MPPSKKRGSQLSVQAGFTNGSIALVEMVQLFPFEPLDLELVPLNHKKNVARVVYSVMKEINQGVYHCFSKVPKLIIKLMRWTEYPNPSVPLPSIVASSKYLVTYFSPSLFRFWELQAPHLL